MAYFLIGFSGSNPYEYTSISVDGGGCQLLLWVSNYYSIIILWKTTYSKSNDEVLWQIIFDIISNKIKLMHINWEQE